MRSASGPPAAMSFANAAPSYHPDPAVYDDLLRPDGLRRSKWGALGSQLADAAEGSRLVQWQQQAERALLSAGAGHLGVDPAEITGGRVQPHDASIRLDPIPVVIEHWEWIALERGMAQRARLLDAVLRDLYGDRRSISAGVLPAAAVVGAPGYLHPAVGVQMPRWIVRMASDIVRDATGRFVVLQDHTDVPVGVGYALAYRSVSARLFPDALRDATVMGAGQWLAGLRTAIAATAPVGHRNPRTVALASAGSPRFVDHSLLAAQLGYHLAEDLDIAVAGGRLVLRSLGGLEPIDTLLRCTDDAGSDPLEIPGTTGGVPGLLGLARRGRVGIANAIGAGVGSHLTLQAFLPELSRFLLGEELLLPNVETRWCGDANHRQAVLDTLGSWVLHDTDPSGGASVAAGPISVFGSALSDADVAIWSMRIKSHPHRFVAQRKLVLGTSPVIDGSLVRPGVVAVRMFASNGPGGVSVLPGGIGRVVRADYPVMAQASAIGKDVWVRGPDAETRHAIYGADADSTIVVLPQVDLGTSIPIRAAETLFWMGRNAERADTIARLAGVVLNRIQQDPWAIGLGDGALAAVMIAALRSVSGWVSQVPVHGMVPLPHAAPSTLPGLTSDSPLHGEMAAALGARPGALLDAIARLADAASGVRQFLSASTWRIVASLPVDAAAAYAGLTNPGAASGELLGLTGDSLDRLSLSMAGFGGLVHDSLVRGPGWRFLEIGRRIERALLVLGLVEAVLVELPPDAEQVAYEVLLASCESLVAYRRRHRSHVVLDTVAASLLADSENPRAVAFQLDELQRLIAGLPDRAGLVAQRRVVGDARRACALPISSNPDVLSHVLSIRNGVLTVAETLPRIWFRTADVRARRVRSGRLS